VGSPPAATIWSSWYIMRR